MVEKQTIVKLTADRKSMRARTQTLAITSTTISNAPKKEKRLVYLVIDAERVEQG